MRVLGLRMVKKTVNQDDPTVYHLFYADELGSPGSDITFFEYPGARRGTPGDGMVHRVLWRVAAEDALAFWEERLQAEGASTDRRPGSLRFSDPEGLAHELIVDGSGDEPLVARHPEIPQEVALQGFAGVRAFSSDPERSRMFLESVLGFAPDGDGWEARGGRRGSTYVFDVPPAGRGVPGAGTIHHVAWSSSLEEHRAWHERVTVAGAGPSPIIDRFWFRSIYFREPSGVLFEIATLGPGFTADESLETLGQALTLPPDFEHLRGQLDQVLTPLPEVTRVA